MDALGRGQRQQRQREVVGRDAEELCEIQSGLRAAEVHGGASGEQTDAPISLMDARLLTRHCTQVRLIGDQ